MDFSELLKVGETSIKEFVVKPEHSADRIGNTGVTVLSTPSMIGFMEATAGSIVDGNIPKNFRPVGTKISVEHINSTSVNEKVTVKAILTSVEGRKLRFDVEAYNEKCKIGFGSYEQHIINLNNFLNKQ